MDNLVMKYGVVPPRGDIFDQQREALRKLHEKLKPQPMTGAQADGHPAMVVAYLAMPVEPAEQAPEVYPVPTVEPTLRPMAHAKLDAALKKLDALTELLTAVRSDIARLREDVLLLKVSRSKDANKTPTHFRRRK